VAIALPRSALDPGAVVGWLRATKDVKEPTKARIAVRIAASAIVRLSGPANAKIPIVVPVPSPLDPVEVKPSAPAPASADGAVAKSEGAKKKPTAAKGEDAKKAGVSILHVPLEISTAGAALCYPKGERVRVFHTAAVGALSARNLAKGEDSLLYFEGTVSALSDAGGYLLRRDNDPPDEMREIEPHRCAGHQLAARYRYPEGTALLYVDETQLWCVRPRRGRRTASSPRGRGPAPQRGWWT
jgi:hypothetical protein